MADPVAELMALGQRVAAKAARATRTRTSLSDLVRIARDEASNSTRRFLRMDPPSRKIACHSGCDACCHFLVVTTAIEALTVAEHVTGTWSQPDRTALIDRLRRRAALARKEQRSPCAFLVDHRCTVYSVRPLVCEGHNGIDPKECADNPQHTIWRPQDESYKAACDGLHFGASRSGLPHEGLELCAAVLIALETDRAAQRYLDGEPLFRNARVYWIEDGALHADNPSMLRALGVE